MGGRAAVCRARDGTLHRERERAPRSFAELEFFASTGPALQALARAGFPLVVITNQSAVAAGEVSVTELDALHAELARRHPVAACYACPHHPERGLAPYVRECGCRKPRSGLLERACADLDLDPRRSWIVGDARRDLEAGLALGARAILVLTGKGERELASLDASLRGRILIARDLGGASAQILAAHAAQGR